MKHFASKVPPQELSFERRRRFLFCHDLKWSALEGTRWILNRMEFICYLYRLQSRGSPYLPPTINGLARNVMNQIMCFWNSLLCAEDLGLTIYNSQSSGSYQKHGRLDLHFTSSLKKGCGEPWNQANINTNLSHYKSMIVCVCVWWQICVERFHIHQCKGLLYVIGDIETRVM